MRTPAIIMTFAIAFSVMAVVVVLVRRHRLRDRYALIWVLLAVGIVLLAAARPLLDRLSQSLGIQSGVTVLVVISLLAVLGVLLQLSISVSRLERALQDVAEAVALQATESGNPVQEPDDL
jgi:hypothetical protein